MTANTLKERKKQINDIKASFPETVSTGKYGNITHATTEEEGTVFRLSKVRLLFAVLIFAAFVYCDQSTIKIKGYTTKDLYEKLEETISFEKIIQSVENML